MVAVLVRESFEDNGGRGPRSIDRGVITFFFCIHFGKLSCAASEQTNGTDLAVSSWE